MERKKQISQVTEANSTPEQLKARKDHIAQGYKMTNMKETLLHNLPIFNTFVGGSYIVSEELEKKIPSRSVYIFDYVVSTGNDCLVCGGYFERLLDRLGIDFETFSFNDEENDLIAFAKALTEDPNHVPDDVYEKLQARYDEETLVVLITHAVYMLANNYFNNIAGVDPSELIY